MEAVEMGPWFYGELIELRPWAEAMIVVRNEAMIVLGVSLVLRAMRGPRHSIGGRRTLGGAHLAEGQDEGDADQA